MTTSHWTRPHSFTSSNVTTDVAILGGGYLGLSTAYWLTELRPDLRITIIERSYCGAGASGRNAGFLTKGSSVFFRSLQERWGAQACLKIFQFMEESLELVHQKILRASPEIKFERSSSLTLFHLENGRPVWPDFPLAETNFQWVENSHLPLNLREGYLGGHESGPEYKINPVQFLASMRKSLESRKVQFIDGVSAFEIRPEGVATEINTIKTKQVVLALNGYFPQFHSSFKSLVTPRRAQMLAVELDSDFAAPSLYYEPADRVYWRKTQDNILIIGGKRLLDEEGEVGDFEKVTPSIQCALEDHLKQRLGLKFKVLHRWSGTMGFTKHELPFISKVENSPLPTFAVGGLSGHGMGLGFKSGMEMAELVSGLKDKSFFSPFSSIEIKL